MSEMIKKDHSTIDESPSKNWSENEMGSSLDSSIDPLFALPSKKTSEEVYAFGYLLYQNKRYQEATIHFRLLIEAHPSEVKYLKSLGASLQMLKDYEGALKYYQKCAKLKSEIETDPYLLVQEADCYLALNKVDTALQTLEKAQLIAKKMNNKTVLNHVTLMQQQWKQPHHK